MSVGTDRLPSRRVFVGSGLALVVFIVLAFWLNAGVRLPCRDVCGSDIGRLYDARGINRDHPPFFDRDLEYPPVIGLLMYAADLPFGPGMRAPFLVNAVILTALAAATTWMLWRRYGAAARRWALAPPLVIQGLTNWDLLAVAPGTIGLLQWEAGNAFSAGALIGVGVAAKLFPALFVPIVAASAARTRQWERVRHVIAGALLGAGVFAIPVYVAAPRALRFFLKFHGARGPTRGSVWFYAFRNLAMKPWISQSHAAHIANVTNIAFVCATIVVLVANTARGRVTPVAACGLATIAFIVTNKVYSPQYDLWILPFLVMLPVPTKLVGHFYASSVAVFVLTATAPSLVHSPGSLYVVAVPVLYRLVVLGVLARAFIAIGSAGELDQIPAREPADRYGGAGR